MKSLLLSGFNFFFLFHFRSINEEAEDSTEVQMPELKPEVQLEPPGGRESNHVAAPPPLSPPSLHQQAPVRQGPASGKSNVPPGEKKAERPVKRKRGWVKGRPRTKFGATPKMDDKKKKENRGEGDDKVIVALLFMNEVICGDYSVHEKCFWRDAAYDGYNCLNVLWS